MTDCTFVKIVVMYTNEKKKNQEKEKKNSKFALALMADCAVQLKCKLLPSLFSGEVSHFPLGILFHLSFVFFAEAGTCTCFFCHMYTYFVLQQVIRQIPRSMSSLWMFYFHVQRGGRSREVD